MNIQQHSNQDSKEISLIKTVEHFFKSSYPNPSSGSCNIDINCPLGSNWQVEKQAVNLLIINTYSGTLECTGSLINNTALDSKPYLLTAYHCISNEYDAENTLIYFNFESQSCNGTGNKLNVATDKQVLYGGKLVASSYDHDFALIELNQHPPMEVKPYYAGWDLSNSQFLDTRHYYSSTRMECKKNFTILRATNYLYIHRSFFRRGC